MKSVIRDLWLPLPLAAVAAVETVSDGGGQVALRTSIATATVLGLLGRRRQPALAAAWVSVGMAAESVATESPDQVGVLVAFVISAFFVGGAPDLRDKVLGACMLGLAVTVSIALDPSDTLANVPPTLLLFLAVPMALGTAFARRGNALERMTTANDELRREAHAAVEAERRRLSHELHDVVSHAVTLIAITAEAGATAVRSDPDAAEQRFAAIADTSRDALAELQALLALLDADTDGARAPGLASLDALVGGVRSTGAQVELVVRGEVDGLPRDADLTAYRVVQEAMTNAIRHSRSPSMEVEVVGDPEAVHLRISSSGTPHRSSYGGTGRGLRGLADRVGALAGEFESGRAEDGSFVVAASLPRVAS